MGSLCSGPKKGGEVLHDVPKKVVKQIETPKVEIPPKVVEHVQEQVIIPPIVEIPPKVVEHVQEQVIIPPIEVNHV
jgi:hypothetical protein